MEISYAYENSAETIYQMLDEMPQLELQYISISQGDDEVVNTLAEKYSFGKKEDFYKIMHSNDFSDYDSPQSEQHEYLSEIISI